MCSGLNMLGSNSEHVGTFQNVSTHHSHLDEHQWAKENYALDFSMQENKPGPNFIAHDVKLS